MAIAVNQIPNVVDREAEITAINLFNNFDDTLTTGLVARFELYNTALNGGVTNVVLFDQAGAGAPLTVQNFRNYVNSGAYTNTIIHRSVPGFVVQGGGFTVNGLDAVLEETPGNGAAAVGVIPANPPVQNEFSTGRSNLRGTIAMAKLGGDPNSATNQWFFNLANNSANLDTQNGGFTVFGQVLPTNLGVIDAIAALPTGDGRAFFNQGAFDTVPVQIDPANPGVNGDANLVRYRSITVSQVSELRFSVVRNSNPALVNARIQNNRLVLSYRPAPIKTAVVTVRATNLLGQFVQDTFSVTVQPNLATAGNDTLSGTNGDNRLSGLGGNDLIFGFGGTDRLFGNAGRDRINSGAGSDILDGGAEADLLLGSGGRDRLIGGLGTDTLTGGADVDQFVFDIGRAFRPALMGIDAVTDFQRPDKIVLDRTTFTALSGSQVSFQAVSNAIQAQNSRALITYIASTGALYYNPNGRALGFGGGGQFADFRNGLSLAASDFLVQA